MYRTTSSLLRIETNRVLQQTRDQGAMNALAQAIQLLEYSTPSDSSNPSRTVFTYDVSVTVQNTSGGCTATDYTVVYTAGPTWVRPAGRCRCRRDRRPCRCRTSATIRNGRDGRRGCRAGPSHRQSPARPFPRKESRQPLRAAEMEHGVPGG